MTPFLGLRARACFRLLGARIQGAQGGGAATPPPRDGVRRLTNLLIWLTICCMWLMWVITYMMQLHPLIEPIPVGEE